MTRRKPIFAPDAVGVAYISPENTETVHLDINPETGSIIVAEAHTIRMRGSGVKNELLVELGTTASKLISEFLSNYLLNSPRTADRVKAKDDSFRTFLGQTISGLDQMLIETVTQGKEQALAYRMGIDGKTKQQSSAQNSLLNRISNSLEALVYYDGGIHLSHRGESQQYLVSKKVQKLTQDHVAGGLFSKIGDLGDFIPQIHTQTVQMASRDRLVVFSREAAVSSFPLNQLHHWLGNGEPKAQAQQVSEQLKKLGRTGGCVLVFAPNWQAEESDNRAANSEFALNDLGQQKPPKDQVVNVMSSGAKRETSISTTIGGMPTKANAAKTRQPHKGKRNSVSSSAAVKAKSVVDETHTYREKKRTTASPKAITKKRTSHMPLASSTAPSPATSSAATITDAEIQRMAEQVLKRMMPHLASFEKTLQKRIESEFAQFESRLTALMDERLSKLQADVPSPPNKTSRPRNSLGQFVHAIGNLWQSLASRWKIGIISGVSILTIAAVVVPGMLHGENHTNSNTDKADKSDSGKTRYPSKRHKTKASKRKQQPPSLAQSKNSKPAAAVSKKDSLNKTAPDIPPEPLTPKEQYEKGLSLYLAGDLGKTKDKKRLNDQQRREALEAALPIFTQLTEADTNMSNAWYLRGRTEYALAKTETNNDTQKSLATAALNSYDQYIKQERNISDAKMSSITRNKKRLKSMLK